ncbi:hypothetical protein BU607_03510 [Staphylococcus auricularis]|uniref:Uncharacterized protein n=1 Tax=Staphylococcus auricularis TaxID=29379 RepID=A0ABX5IFS1_9STAP|nr:hypothetical protein BU607_03510 [Staphylococcus auricularis]PTH27086.1 hypothetical protein BU608_02835 [Staphylococcus auricularis]
MYMIYQTLIFITLSLITFLGFLNLLEITNGVLFMQFVITFVIAYFYYQLAFKEKDSKLGIFGHIYEITLLVLSIIFIIYSSF